MSLQMLDTAGFSARDSVLDVGGGASPMAGVLLGRGFADVTVLDISATAMQYTRRRLGPQAERVRWLMAEVLTWRPQRRYDRAVFHFLTRGKDQRYLHTLESGHCRGRGRGVRLLRSGRAAALLGSARRPLQPVRTRWASGQRLDADRPGQDREEHITPAGVTQPFTWAAFRRQP